MTALAVYDPVWTNITYKPGGGRDALSVETLSEAILADLLPGINNQTRRSPLHQYNYLDSLEAKQ